MNAASGSLLAVSLLASPASAESLPFFVGTGADGVYASALDTDTGAMSPPRLVAETQAAGFLWIHPTLPVLYAVGGAGGGESQLVAFRIGAEAHLERMASVGTGGRGACYVTVSPNGRYAAAAHYGSGSVAIFPLADDGTPGEATVVQHTGRSTDERRQTAPHAHSVRFTADSETLMAADLGTDKLYVYGITGGGLEPADPPAIDLPPGSGPRHFVFAPDGRSVLILNELRGTVSVAPIDPVTGEVTRTVSAVADDLPADAERASAEILFHPGGGYVYASNRRPGEIAWFAWDGQALERRGGVPSGGDWPRNFRLTDDGRFLLVANQRSGGVAAFRIDEATGRPVPTGQKIGVAGAQCIRFLA